MAKVKLNAGVELDLLNKSELADSLQDQFDREWAERGRGIKLIRIRGATSGNISTTVGFAIQGPQQGYVWALRSLGAVLSSSQTLQAYVTGDNGTSIPANGPVANLAAGTVVFTTWSGVQAFLNGGEFLTIAAGGSATAQFTMYALEAPAELAWKLI
jgi:hypothetical protein